MALQARDRALMWLLSLALRHWKPLAALALILALLASGYALKARVEAQKREVAALKAEVVKAKAQAAAEAHKRAQAEASIRVVTKYVDRVKVVEGRTRTIIKEIPVYVPADSPNLPAGFRVLHDAAAQGVLPDPAGIADAAPVPAQDAAGTIAGNYGICHATAEQVRALQDWIREQQKLAK
jgi:hypothetical protein